MLVEISGPKRIEWCISYILLSLAGITFGLCGENSGKTITQSSMIIPVKEDRYAWCLSLFCSCPTLSKKKGGKFPTQIANIGGRKDFL